MADRRAGRAVPRAFAAVNLTVSDGGDDPGDPAISDASAAPSFQCVFRHTSNPPLFH